MFRSKEQLVTVPLRTDKEKNIQSLSKKLSSNEDEHTDMCSSGKSEKVSDFEDKEEEHHSTILVVSRTTSRGTKIF